MLALGQWLVVGHVDVRVLLVRSPGFPTQVQIVTEAMRGIGHIVRVRVVIIHDAKVRTGSAQM